MAELETARIDWISSGLDLGRVVDAITIRIGLVGEGPPGDFLLVGNSVAVDVAIFRIFDPTPSNPGRLGFISQPLKSDFLAIMACSFILKFWFYRFR